MPLYEYQCTQCRQTFEVMQPVSAKPLKKCIQDNCGGKVQRLVSASGFILKGTGWYATDYPSESRKKGWESESKVANRSGKEPPAGKAEASDASPQAAKNEDKKGKTSAPSPGSKNPYSGGSRKKVPKAQ
ncbi:MAG: zinc ribbon domain-containing protein [Nitrospinaceae bacterium]|nr:zinc ribbon domain-containing protein [Nitrospinaceae bacterium]NIR53246.1 zinc ribbon domain-containing protein [Nitrospinaceae bacterium]NIS83644.1 zinc ribbon domain-containing protein [Nitrospinaceae bacterium]NIT80436.1 zinc ribbon domain-containing protein [Nitrospinaceae bacterium]NIU42949.1 zinc ribbon domain-containing protein [Nitrospinaceae bacterium]